MYIYIVHVPVCFWLSEIIQFSICRDSCILGDDSGLGKRTQTVAFMKELFDYGYRGPMLVISPSEKISHWKQMLESWTALNVVEYSGSMASRRIIQKYEFHYTKVQVCFTYMYIHVHVCMQYVHTHACIHIVLAYVINEIMHRVHSVINQMIHAINT